MKNSGKIRKQILMPSLARLSKNIAESNFLESMLRSRGLVSCMDAVSRARLLRLGYPMTRAGVSVMLTLLLYLKLGSSALLHETVEEQESLSVLGEEEFTTGSRTQSATSVTSFLTT